MQNKPNKRCYRDVLNQMYILVLILPNTTINISTNINFEQIMVNFSTNTNFEQIMVDLVLTDYVRYFTKQTLDSVLLKKLKLTLDRSFDW